MVDEQRLIELEIKMAYQDKLLDELNQVIYKQQLKIDEMEKFFKEVVKKFASDIDPTHNKPPHY